MLTYWYLKEKKIVGHAMIPLPTGYQNHDTLKIKDLPSMPLLFYWDPARNDLCFFWADDVYGVDFDPANPKPENINPALSKGKVFPDCNP
jgi:hypothetical protein